MMLGMVVKLNVLVAIIGAGLVVGLAGCSSSATTAQSPPRTTTAATIAAQAQTTQAPLTAATIAAKIASAVSTVSAITDLTEANDGNHLLGRPHQYTSATVLSDGAGTCTPPPGVECGATIEVFAAADDAAARAAYIDAIIKASPMFTEYDTVDGTAVLRVAGHLDPATAAAYKTAFLAAIG